MALAIDVAPIEPLSLYPLGTFHRASGISPTRARAAKREHGIELPTIDVGRRKFVRGSDAIEFIERLAALPKQSA